MLLPWWLGSMSKHSKRQKVVLQTGTPIFSWSNSNRTQIQGRGQIHHLSPIWWETNKRILDSYFKTATWTLIQVIKTFLSPSTFSVHLKCHHCHEHITEFNLLLLGPSLVLCWFLFYNTYMSVFCNFVLHLLATSICITESHSVMPYS